MTEPAAWTTLALVAHGEVEAARRSARWLAERQQSTGAVGVSARQDEPRWPTSLALLAWCAVNGAEDSYPFQPHIERAVKWSLFARGETGAPSPMIGHDTSLVGWSWAANTHSWLEPTCFFVTALRAAGRSDHPRVREGLELAVDRLLPDGGANYGNTIVLGQQLLPHVQSSGIAMLALAGEPIADERIEKSLDYLDQALGPATAPASLSFACLGLAAHGRRPDRADDWIAGALENNGRKPLAEYEQALLLLAAVQRLDWLHQEDAARPLSAEGAST